MRISLLWTIIYSFQSFTPILADGDDGAATYRPWLGALSYDSMEGWGAGTEGVGRAAAWIEENLYIARWVE